MITAIADAALCLVLLGVIAVGLKLWKRIDNFKSGQDELRELIRQLNAASEVAQNSILQLRASIKEADGRLGDRLDRARALSDELSIITESGDRLATRLTDGLVDGPQKNAKSMADIRRPRVPVSVQGGRIEPSKSESDALARILQGLR